VQSEYETPAEVKFKKPKAGTPHREGGGWGPLSRWEWFRGPITGV